SLFACILLSLGIIALDQWTKHLARGLTSPRILIPGVLGLTFETNTGMAFSFLSGNSWLLGILSLLVILAFILILRRFQLSKLAIVSAVLIVSGALSNMLDRLFLGAVTDMLELLFMSFAVFNVADSAVTIGCALLAVCIFRDPWTPISGHTRQQDSRAQEANE
ncbi:MAG: signal peptidase II, partial [Clostridia bacterium]|nr:signal peptidase II [Clostridia bacterium]